MLAKTASVPTCVVQIRPQCRERVTSCWSQQRKTLSPARCLTSSETLVTVKLESTAPVRLPVALDGMDS